MRIAQVVSTFAPRLGGMGIVCAQEALELVKAGHEVTVFTLQYDGEDYRDHDKQFPFKIVRLKPWIKLGDAGLVPQIIRKIQNSFDLVHLHYPFYGGAEWLWFIKVPLVITYHMDAQVGGIKLLIEYIYNLLWPQLLFAKAKTIITVDKIFSQSKLLKGVSQDKIVEIPNGVDVEIFKSQTLIVQLPDLRQYANKKIILFVGNFLPLKRLDLLLKSVQLLQNKEVLLLVVGGVARLETYKQMSKELGVESQVTFAGPCQDKNILAQYYNLATCVVVPSDYESFSLVAIEAMACAKPLVLSNLPGLQDKFPQAVFFAKGSAESLRNALESVLSLSNDEIKKMGEQNRVQVVEKFSLQTHLEKLENVYYRIIDS